MTPRLLLLDSPHLLATTIAAVLSVYLLAVSFLRNKRGKETTQRIRSAPTDTARLEESRKAVLNMSSLEFPLGYRLSLELALFRTYAIPSISALVEETKKFESECGIRCDNTDLLIREMTENRFDSERSITALQRINAIHSGFKDKISNQDMLYVLSLFVFEPIRWIAKYEFRPLYEEECEALYTVWHHIGTRMGIENIPQTRAKFEEYNAWYEERHMVYASSNTTITEALMKLFLGLAPTFLHPLGRAVTLCVMDERLRTSVQYPDPNPFLLPIVRGFLWLRQIVIRHLCLPRPEFLSARRTPFSSTGAAATVIMCPRFHIYDAPYRNGYQISRLGNAPVGELYPRNERPSYARTT